MADCAPGNSFSVSVTGRVGQWVTAVGAPVGSCSICVGRVCLHLGAVFDAFQ